MFFVVLKFGGGAVFLMFLVKIFKFEMIISVYLSMFFVGNYEYKIVAFDIIKFFDKLFKCYNCVVKDLNKGEFREVRMVD